MQFRSFLVLEFVVDDFDHRFVGIVVIGQDISQSNRISSTNRIDRRFDDGDVSRSLTKVSDGRERSIHRSDGVRTVRRSDEPKVNESLEWLPNRPEREK